MDINKIIYLPLFIILLLGGCELKEKTSTPDIIEILNQEREDSEKINEILGKRINLLKDYVDTISILLGVSDSVVLSEYGEVNIKSHKSFGIVQDEIIQGIEKSIEDAKIMNANNEMLKKEVERLVKKIEDLRRETNMIIAENSSSQAMKFTEQIEELTEKFQKTMIEHNKIVKRKDKQIDSLNNVIDSLRIQIAERETKQIEYISLKSKPNKLYEEEKKLWEQINLLEGNMKLAQIKKYIDNCKPCSFNKLAKIEFDRILYDLSVKEYQDFDPSNLQYSSIKRYLSSEENKYRSIKKQDIVEKFYEDFLLQEILNNPQNNDNYTKYVDLISNPKKDQAALESIKYTSQKPQNAILLTLFETSGLVPTLNIEKKKYKYVITGNPICNYVTEDGRNYWLCEFTIAPSKKSRQKKEESQKYKCKFICGENPNDWKIIEL